ncbi:Cysteine-rich receptor-like protein kinase 3 [Nymphaea thermarum]|nr:Cysteine-rich receptor-like protein kinase 3 [Nymphaea thermarum]
MALFATLVCLLFSSFIFFSDVLADPRINQAALVCGTIQATNRSIFVTNFIAALDAVTPQINRRRYAQFVTDSTVERVYAFGQCMDDLSQSDCDLCFAQSKTGILRCVPFQLNVKEGRNYLDGCYLRYDYYDFFSEITSPMDRTLCNSTRSYSNQSDFVVNVKGIVGNMSSRAVSNNGFWRGSVGSGNSTVYAIGQCWETLNMSSCKTCLDTAASKIDSCLPSFQARVLSSGCYLRYADYQFYNDSSTASTSSGGGRRVPIIVSVTFSALVFLVVLAVAAFLGKRRVDRRRKEKKQLGGLAAAVKKSALNYKYETLERATNYFNRSNKLGQGGSGSVYKGILADGKIVAIKRLFFSTRQWVDDFFNEVSLISGVEHKNLVKLLGCSITGPESLLVYEYVPNKSLDQVMFGNDSTILSWNMRKNIILGTAKGLAYLHEESKLRIIHRDIKLSNILLDDDFTAKIADFGLARCFPQDKSHISTAVAGTLGYMAPEYLVRGKLTEKADVYSFGVVVIEIVTGKKNNSCQPNCVYALQMVWSFHLSNRLSEAVDPKLEGNFSREDAVHMLKVGLLCCQASAELRPPMSMVVKMLTDINCNIPSPNQPPFLSPNVASQVPFAVTSTSVSQEGSATQSSRNSMTITVLDPR